MYVWFQGPSIWSLWCRETPVWYIYIYLYVYMYVCSFLMRNIQQYICSVLMRNIEQFICWFAVSFSCGFLTDNYHVKKFNVQNKVPWNGLFFNSRDLVSISLLFGCWKLWWWWDSPPLAPQYHTAVKFRDVELFNKTFFSLYFCIISFITSGPIERIAFNFTTLRLQMLLKRLFLFEKIFFV